MRTFMDRFAAGAIEIGTDPVPPVPPDLDLDLDLDIDFDSLPEIDVPGEDAPTAPPQPKAPAAPQSQAPAAPASACDEAARRRFAWWPLLGGTLALLVVALAAVPFAILRLNDMSRDMSLLAKRVEAAEAENERLTDALAREAVDVVATRLAETERRIERVRSALDEVRRRGAAPSVAATSKETPTPSPPPPPVVAKPPELPKPVEPRAESPKIVANAPLLPPPDLEQPKGGAPVGTSKKDKPAPLASASSVRSAPAPPTPVTKDPPKPAPPTPKGSLPPVAKDEPARQKPPSRRIPLPTELYDENEGDE